MAHKIALVIDGTKHVGDQFIDHDDRIEDGDWKALDQVHVYMGDRASPDPAVIKKLPADKGTNFLVTNQSPPISSDILKR